MNLKSCNLCSLGNTKLHSKFKITGNKQASVFIVLGKIPTTESQMVLEAEFIRQLNYELKYDWYKTYAIKCATKGKVDPSCIKKCRMWLKSEFKSVKPQLIILMGKIAVYSMLGDRYKNLKQNIFYGKSDQMYFIGDSLSYNNMANIQENLDRLIYFIKKEYVR